jgi:hypothetical protein
VSLGTPTSRLSLAARVAWCAWSRAQQIGFFNSPRVHFMRNVLAHAGKQGRRVVSAFIGTAFAQDDAEAARTQWRQVADQLRPRVKKLAELMDETESDVLAYMSFPPAHRPKLHSTNPIERVNGEIALLTTPAGARGVRYGYNGPRKLPSRTSTVARATTIFCG